MTSAKAITSVAFLLLVGLTLTWILQGTWVDASTHSTFKSLTLITTYNVFGLFNVPWINPSFFTSLPKLFTFDFTFFGGNYGYIRYLFYCVAIGMVWGIVIVVISIIFNFWSRAK